MDYIADGDNYILTTHVNPDGDGLGSEVALRRFFSEKGKTAQIVNPAPIPEMYKFLDQGGALQVYRPEVHDEEFFRDKTVFSLDNSSLKRMGQLGRVVEAAGRPIVCLDHHTYEGGLPGLYYVDRKASATGELVYKLIKGLGGTIDRVVAEAIYVAILTDTGGFRFPNTTAESFRIASELVGVGISPAHIYNLLYEMNRPSKLRLMGLALKNLEIYADGRIALLAVTADMIDSVGAERVDVDGLVEVLRTIKGVELGVLLLELPGNRVKASLRSKWDLDVHELASLFGGGGHPRAAGFVVPGTLEEVKRELLGKSVELLTGREEDT